MKIYGMVKSSFIDYPKKISAVLFTGGCNFRCGYCHNPELVNCVGKPLEEKEIMGFLKKRKKYLDGVCISGGEPTLYKEINELTETIKELGFLIKLDTNGTNPEMLSKLIEEKKIDYVAMDIKGPLDKYSAIANREVDTRAIEESISIILNAPIEYEFRTTIHKEILDSDDLLKIVQLINGANRYSLQNIKLTSPLLIEDSTYTAFSKEELDHIKDQLKVYVKELNIRY